MAEQLKQCCRHSGVNISRDKRRGWARVTLIKKEDTFAVTGKYKRVVLTLRLLSGHTESLQKKQDRKMV